MTTPERKAAERPARVLVIEEYRRLARKQFPQELADKLAVLMFDCRSDGFHAGLNAAREQGQEPPKCKGCESHSLDVFEHDECLTDKVLDKELGRWQQAIYELCRKHAIAPDCIDGGGTDSGDPLDFTLAEIGQVICQLENPDDYRENSAPAPVEQPGPRCPNDGSAIEFDDSWNPTCEQGCKWFLHSMDFADLGKFFLGTPQAAPPQGLRTELLLNVAMAAEQWRNGTLSKEFWGELTTKLLQLPTTSAESPAAPCPYQVGQVVRWTGQEGECQGLITAITEPQPGNYVLHMGDDFGLNFSQVESVSPAAPETEDKGHDKK